MSDVAEFKRAARPDDRVPRPAGPAPPKTAAYGVREAWAREFVAWFLDQTPDDGPLPDDVRPTHRWEIEFNMCLLDPPTYEQHINYELGLSK